MTVRINISITCDTLDRLDQYAFENHSSRSKAITDLVWKAHVKNAQLRGQISLDEYMNKHGSKKAKKNSS